MKNMDEIRKYLLSPEGNEKLISIYGSDNAEGERKRALNLLELHGNNFTSDSGSNKCGLFSAPGRTEIGGNHTDHNLGKVLAAGVNLDTLGAAVTAIGNTVRIKSEGYDMISVDLDNLEALDTEKETPGALVRGIARYFRDRGNCIGGFDCSITSSVLPGSGLSSSASFEVLIASVFNGLYNNNAVPLAELAQAGKFAENNYYGKPSGLMDQMACALGGIAALDFRIPEDPEIRQLNIDFGNLGYALMVTDTRGDHVDLSPEYASIPREMKAVAALLGEETCRGISMSELFRNSGKIRKTCGDRAFLRAFHYLKENERVDAQLAALERGDGQEFADLVNDSGRSSSRYLQNLFVSGEDKSQELVVACAAAENFLGKRGAVRVHGGGFAGTTLAVVPIEMKDGYIELMDSIFGKDSAVEIAVRNTPAGMIAG